MIIGFHLNAVHPKYFLFVTTTDEHNLLLVFLHLCTAIKMNPIMPILEFMVQLSWILSFQRKSNRQEELKWFTMPI